MCGVGDVYQIDIPHLQPEERAPVSRHGERKYYMYGSPYIEDDTFRQAAALVRELLIGNVNTYGPSLPLGVASFVSGVPR